MGEFLKAMPKATGAAGHAGPGRGNAVPIGNRVSETPTLREIGITKKQSATAQKLARIIAQPDYARAARDRSIPLYRSDTLGAIVACVVHDRAHARRGHHRRGE